MPADRLVDHFVSDLSKLDVVPVTKPACGKPAGIWGSYRVEFALEYEGGNSAHDGRLRNRQGIGSDLFGAYVPVVGVDAEISECRVRRDVGAGARRVGEWHLLLAIDGEVLSLAEVVRPAVVRGQIGYHLF